jgi:tetratricopeptide (TPR) repeat protein
MNARRFFVALLASIGLLTSIDSAAESVAPSKEEIAALATRGQWLELRKRMDEAIRTNVHGLNAHYLRGVALYNLLDPAAAIPDLKLGTEVAPQSVMPWIYLGRAYRRAGLPEEAVGAFKKALEVSPDNTLALSLLWETYDFQGKDAEASELRKRTGTTKSAAYDWIANSTNGSEAWPLSNPQAEHATAAPTLKAVDPATIQLIARGTSLWEQGDASGATAILEPLILPLERSYGRFHPEAVKVRSVLVIAMAEQMKIDKAAGYLNLAGGLEQAVTLGRENLKRRSQLFGPDSEQAAIAQLVLA